MGYGVGGRAHPEPYRSGGGVDRRSLPAVVRTGSVSVSFTDVCARLEVDSLGSRGSAWHQTDRQRGAGGVGLRRGGPASGMAALRTHNPAGRNSGISGRRCNAARAQSRRSGGGFRHRDPRLVLSGFQLHAGQTELLVPAAAERTGAHRRQVAPVPGRPSRGGNTQAARTTGRRRRSLPSKRSVSNTNR